MYWLVPKQRHIQRRLTFGILATASNLAFISGTIANESELQGKWISSDKATTVNIEACSGSSDLCAVVVAEILAPGEKTAIGNVLVKEIKKTEKNRWRGKYIDGQSVFNADITLKGDGSVDFKACTMLVLCETETFTRR